MATEAGYYWIQHKRDGRWSIARHDGDDDMPWTLIGNDTPFETRELFGDEAGCVLGPKLTPPT